MDQQTEKTSLPLPVQRYFDLVLPEGFQIIKTVELTHGGSFRTSPKNGWMKIRGKQSFYAGSPGFEWVGKTRMFRAIDKFEDGRGSLRVWVLGFIPIAKEKGPHVDQGELLRWLVEGIWFPTNLLPSDKMQWHAIDEQHAKLTYDYGDMDLYLDVSFNEKGEIIRTESMRYMEKNKLSKWIGEVSDYREFDGFRVPTQIKVFWDLEEALFQYVDFKVVHIKYTYQ